MRSIRIFIYDVTHPGGVERAAVNLANSMVDEFKVTIISQFSSNGTPFYEIDPRVRILHLGVDFTPGIKNYVTQNIKTLVKIKRSISFDRDSISIGMSVNINSLLAIIKILGGSGIFFGCEHMNYDEATKIAQMVRKSTYKKLDRVIVLTEAEKDVFQKQLGLRISVIPNSLPLFPKYPAKLESKRMLCVGRYTYQKGFDRLIPIISSLMRSREDWELFIFGAGEQEDELRRLISLNQLNNIHLAPPTSNIEKEYLDSSIYLLPSRFESFGMVILEAQACGLPVVAYDSSNGPRSLISETNGILIDDGDGPEFSAAVEKLMDDLEYRRRLGQSGRLNAQNYNPDIIRQRWLSLINHVRSGEHS
ncbi:glycosyltransferase family 4 protein [Deinococcus sp. UR1]|uniref:glycosyltransferase family 4 protein n=1 Tax=Deinococcus sp. UR1 TaxID=1704277 RepID=UPI000A93948B|nr:glycosyltransferase family 4 protein [Deinococcus sp. UR1]PIG99081.1 hypothetical protein AMD26_004810 [Deinococcus sp. UR1]